MRKYLWFIIIGIMIPLAVFAGETKVFFSPDGGCQQAVVDAVNGASRTVDIAMYAFTSREIAQALVAANTRGVAVRVFLDKGEANGQYSKSRYLAQNGLDVRYYRGDGLMHNKFAVIDNRLLITGSFNWTPTADRKNQENLLLMTDNGLIKQYSDRFEFLWKNWGT